MGWIGVPLAIAGLWATETVPTDVALVLGGLWAVGSLLGLLDLVLGGLGLASRRRWAADPRIEVLVHGILVSASGAFVAAFAGVEIAGVNVIVGCFVALFLVFLLAAFDAGVPRDRTAESTGLACVGLVRGSWGLTPLGVPTTVGAILVRVGGLLHLRYRGTDVGSETTPNPQ